MEILVIGGGVGGLTSRRCCAMPIGCSNTRWWTATRCRSGHGAARLEPACELVLMNRANPPDAILREVHRRTGGRPFVRIEDVIGAQELAALSENYKRVARFEREALSRRAPLV